MVVFTKKLKHVDTTKLLHSPPPLLHDINVQRGNAVGLWLYHKGLQHLAKKQPKVTHHDGNDNVRNMWIEPLPPHRLHSRDEQRHLSFEKTKLQLRLDLFLSSSDGATQLTPTERGGAHRTPTRENW